MPKPPPKGAAQPASSAGPGLPWLANVATITADEAAAIKDNLMIGLVEFEKGLDSVIGFTSKGHEAFIWQTIDPEDNGTIADLMVQAGMRVPAAAYVVRALANSAWQMHLAGIVGPRFLATWHHYAMYGFGFAMMAGGFPT